jgi:hypothetical protein
MAKSHLRFLAADPSRQAAEFTAFRTLFTPIRPALATFRSLLIFSAGRITSLEKILIGRARRGRVNGEIASL